MRDVFMLDKYRVLENKEKGKISLFIPQKRQWFRYKSFYYDEEGASEVSFITLTSAISFIKNSKDNDAPRMVVAYVFEPTDSQFYEKRISVLYQQLKQAFLHRDSSPY